MPCEDLSIRITGDWPLDPAYHESKFSLIIRLTSAKIEVELKDPCDTGYPDLLECASAVMACVLQEAIGDGFYVRVDVSRAAEIHEPWPRWCVAPSQVNALFETLAPRRVSGESVISFYPVLFWLIPRLRSDLEHKVDQFRDSPSDTALFNEILRAGVIRFSFSDGFADVLAEPHVGALILKWLKSAFQNPHG